MQTGAERLELRQALALSGDVGRDLLAVDWTSTVIGPPEEWPNALATMVRVVLTSRFSMWMAWGPELTFFCNDAYRRDTLGRKYPWALGRSAREVWAEIWPEIGPRIETVMSTGVATWDEALLLFLERNGYPEETYHTFSYSPIPGDDGSIAGMLCVVTEDTERVIAERHMETLRDLGTVPASVDDEREYLQAAARHLAHNPRSLPFTLTYLFDGSGDAVLAAATGTADEDPVAPERVRADDTVPAWPLVDAAQGRWAVVDDLTARFGDVPSGEWDIPPSRALVVPLPGGTGGESPGFIVIGANPFRPVDDVYASFVTLVAQRLGAGVAGARSIRQERLRAEQLAELDRAKTAFFSNVSHEFRTPLTLMLAPLQDALGAGAPLDQDQVGLVHRNGLRLLKLVNTLLDFSRIEAGRMRAEFHPVDAGRHTAELASTFADAARRAGIGLEVDCPSLRELVYLDASLWERIVLNLLSNAFKVTLAGSISVSLHEADGSVRLEVNDTGPGIPAGELPKLFQRFHRVSGIRARSHEGTGIGLALVKELVELHGGTVEVESVPDVGSTFRVRIPQGRAHLPAEQVSDEPIEPARAIAELFVEEALSWTPLGPAEDVGVGVGTGAGGSGAWDGAAGAVVAAADLRGRGGGSGRGAPSRVLIADDNPDLRTYLSRLLSHSFSVTTAGDGEEALQRIREDPPDLLITDAMMPRMDGFALLAELRGDPVTRELPVIMLSARAGEDASIAGLSAGADDYLSKPFSGRELLARVRAHLELSLERRRASAEVRAEQERLQQTIDQLPAGVIIVEAPSGRVMLTNRQVEAILGRPQVEAETVEQYEVYEAFREPREVIPLERRPLGRAIRKGETVQDELLLYPGSDDVWKTLRVSAAPIHNPEGELFAGVLVFQDVTDAVRDQQLLTAQRDILAMITRGVPLRQTLEELAFCAQRLSTYRGKAGIMLVSADGRHVEHAAAPDLPVSLIEGLNGVNIGPRAGFAAAAAQRAESVVVTGLTPGAGGTETEALIAEHGFGACWSVPIRANRGGVVGTFTVYHERPVEPTGSDRRVVELLAPTAALAIERARDVEARTRQLTELQGSLLPRRLPEVKGMESKVAYFAGDRSLEVGGDFYDLFHLGDGRWGFVIGDVCGHGAEAAAVTALTRHTTRAIARLREDPGRVLSFVSDALHDSGYDRFCTAIYGWIQPREGVIEFQLAIGGHPPPLVRRSNGDVVGIEQRGPLLGVFADTQFPTVTGELHEGDLLLMYTDGLYERNARVNGESGLRSLVARLPAGSAQEMLRGLETSALGTPPVNSDDVAILILRAARAAGGSSP